MSGDGSNFLIPSDRALLDTWAVEVRAMFAPLRARGLGIETPYLVGSVLKHLAFRDVDVRLMTPADQHDQLRALIDIDRLNLAVSLWGQKATGLPIDFQVQQWESANEDFAGRRVPLGRTKPSHPELIEDDDTPHPGTEGRT